MKSAIRDIDISALVRDAAQLVCGELQIDAVDYTYDLDVSEDAGVVVRTDIVQRIAARARIAEEQIVASALTVLKGASEAEMHATEGGLAWQGRDRFLNLVPLPLVSEAGSDRPVYRSSLALPRRVFVIKPPAGDPAARRLAARVAVQMLALKLLDHEAQLVVATPQELEQISRVECALTAELSTTWIYPQSAPKPLLSGVLRRLGAIQRVQAESMASDEWGAVDYLPPIDALTVGQQLALAEFNLVSEVDVLGAGRNEVQNLPWLARTVAARLSDVFGSTSFAADECSPAPGLFAGVLRDLSLSRVALVGAARGRVCQYIAFWRRIVTQTLLIINDPAVRQRAARGEYAAADLSCSRAIISVLSETVAAWENHLQHELILT